MSLIEALKGSDALSEAVERGAPLRFYVWDCGDDVCGCSQAVIETWDGVRGGWLQNPHSVWQGEFFTGHDDGAAREYQNVERVLRNDWPEAWALIERTRADTERKVQERKEHGRELSPRMRRSLALLADDPQSPGRLAANKATDGQPTRSP